MKRKNWQRKKGDKVVGNKMWKRERKGERELREREKDRERERELREREQEKGGKREK